MIIPAMVFMILALWLFHTLVERSIAHSAERRSVSWAAHAASRINGLDDIASGAGPTIEDIMAIQAIGEFGDVFRIKVFDTDGTLIFDTSGENGPRANLDDHNAYATSVYETRLPHTEVVSNTDDANRPTYYSETYLPVTTSDGEIIAVVEVYLDQTETHDDTWRNFLVFGLSIVVLIALSFVAPIAIILAMSARLKGTNRALARETEQALSGEQAKSEFISTVSHELRTPLTSIKGALDMVQSERIVELPLAAKNLIAIAVRNTDAMVVLVNDILDINRLSSGALELKLTRTDIAATVKATAKDLECYADARNVTYVIEKFERPAIVCIDEQRISQVLKNLLSNAAKFSPAGEKIFISVEHREAVIRVKIRDRGRGIPQDQRERIFNRFTQIDSSDARSAGGTGLGLAIAKEIVELHDGRIGVRDAPGGGSEFFFDLPDAEIVAKLARVA